MGHSQVALRDSGSLKQSAGKGQPWAPPPGWTPHSLCGCHPNREAAGVTAREAASPSPMGWVGEGTVNLSWWSHALGNDTAFQNPSDLSPAARRLGLRTALCIGPVQCGATRPKWPLST